jgi:pimeloyl-ACP methyl ester carboxylesterase
VDALGREKAVWVGHDWGSPVVWNLASHHPDRCHAVANLCVPYYTIERGFGEVAGDRGSRHMAAAKVNRAQSAAESR